MNHNTFGYKQAIGMQGIIVYKGKYGATQEYAGLLAAALDLPVFESTVTGGQLMKADYVLIGSAVYIGKLQLRNWLIRHEHWLKTKKLFFFIVCGTPASATAKTDKIIADNIPASLQHNAVFFLKGRMVMSKLSLPDRILLHLGAWLNKVPEQRKAMLQDFNGVGVSCIEPLVQAVKQYEYAEQETALQVSNNL
jgi:menaquinone-dependent protoporphyrinogen IX oxidase